jgi:dihydroneopterin aldolase
LTTRSLLPILAPFAAVGSVQPAAFFQAAPPAARSAASEGMELALIRLEGLSVFGHHGARPYEKEAGQRLECDLELEPTDDRAEHSDKLSDAVDYDQLYRTVVEVVEGKSFHLLEALAAETAKTILERFDVRRVKVRFSKQNLGWTTGGRAVIEVVRERT